MVTKVHSYAINFVNLTDLEPTTVANVSSTPNQGDTGVAVIIATSATTVIVVLAAFIVLVVVVLVVKRFTHSKAVLHEVTGDSLEIAEPDNFSSTIFLK